MHVMLEDLLRDFRHAVRMFVRSPGAAFVVVFSLAVSIGANIAIFAIVDALMFRRLPVDLRSRCQRDARRDAGCGLASRATRVRSGPDDGDSFRVTATAADAWSMHVDGESVMAA